MYNKVVYEKLANAAPGESWAILERLDGQGSYQFLMNPESEQWTHSAEFSKLPVALTSQPLVAYKSSETTLSFPSVRLWTPDNSKQLKPLLDTLISFTKPIKAGDDLPLLKLTYGDTVIDRCYLSRFQVTTKMKLGGNVSMVDASMDFLLAPVLPKVELAPLEQSSTIKLTDKELTEASKLVLQAFESQPKLAEKYKTDPKKDQYGVTADKGVLINGKQVATLEQLLGANLPQKWATVKAK